MESFWVSTGVVAVAEIGDKTQLLAIVLAAKFRRPVPIVLGILAATLLNHAAAATLGWLVAQWLDGPIFATLVGIAFLAMAAWALVPDKPDDDTRVRSGAGVFLATLIAFFLVEIGDKTQIATSLLAANFDRIVPVTLGTTAGMMLANVPAVYLAEACTRLVPLRYVRITAALIFAAIGLWVLAAGLPGAAGV
ncbi:TMEM165/GDT1 family protein [Stella sp.]|uniref:TMEM165/GDT1 family protein n=1 Tax=Stella sp. TaxID=2912054 RepID=UPI0035B16DBC